MIEAIGGTGVSLIRVANETSACPSTLEVLPMRMDIIPMRPVMPFHRMKDSKAREGHEVAMMLPVQEEVGFSSVEMGRRFALLQMVFV
jgi:hypothetical protein